MLSDQVGSFMERNFSNAFKRNSSIHCGSSLRDEITRMVSFDRPLGIEKESISTLNPNFLS